MGRKNGTRHPHLIRRGNVFYVRFRVPKRLVARLGMNELCRSLRTSDLAAAKLRAQSASLWFAETIAILEQMTNATRPELEQAARLFFAELCQEADRPRDFTSDPSGSELHWQIEQSEFRISGFDDCLADKAFDKAGDQESLARFEQHLGRYISPEERLVALEMIVRAKRQQMVYFVHGLTKPTKRYAPDDDVFGAEVLPPAMSPITVVDAPILKPELTIPVARDLYLGSLKKEGLGVSTLSETARVLGWLEDKFGTSVALSSLTPDQLRDFRDDIIWLGKGKQGLHSTLSARITEDPEQRLHTDTRQRYWRFTKGFFEWAKSEQGIKDHTHDMVAKFGKAMASRKTQPFTLDEIERLFMLPIYSGSHSTKRLSDHGDNLARHGHWWSGVLMMLYGLRGGECAQLLASDFDFEADIPHLRLGPAILPGGRKRMLKDHLMDHAFPIPEELLALGLREFVEARSKKNKRLFYEFRLGTERASDGISKFWRRQFKRFGLHKPGRGTHVFRHTVTFHLRSAGLLDEQIGRLLGHSAKTVTGKTYGPDHYLDLKLEYLSKLPYLKGLVEKLGGPYDPKKHG